MCVCFIENTLLWVEKQIKEERLGCYFVIAQAMREGKRGRKSWARLRNEWDNANKPEPNILA